MLETGTLRELRGLLTVLAPLALLVHLEPAAAQAGLPPEIQPEPVFVGSEMESYLRLLQLGGVVPLHPWSIRGFSAPELAKLAAADSAHPWATRYALGPDSSAAPRLDLLRPAVELRYNSAFPYGSNDGVLWAGRGLSGSLTLGLDARYGPVSLVLAPTAAWSQNADFALQDNGFAGPQRFADAREPSAIDAPQRFGDGAYARIDPGQSTLRVDAVGVTAGASTANQAWGPAVHYPLVLGNNAPGFPHLFAGTSKPANVGIGRVHARAMWGRLEQSEYSPAVPELSVRFAAGLAGVFTPRGLDGLELGFARFYHIPWVDGGPGASEFLRPFEGVLKAGTSDPNDTSAVATEENQLLSVFARWVAPRSGFEVYGEYGREDHNYDFRDFIMEPDHSGAFTLGLGKVWRRADASFLLFRGELVNTQRTHLHLVRHQGPYYAHHAILQGHTHRGQLLASSAGYGGGGITLSLDRIHAGGSWSLAWSRELRNYLAPDSVSGDPVDVLHSLGGRALFFRGPFDVSAGLKGVYNRNRYFRSNAFNLNGAVDFRLRI